MIPFASQVDLSVLKGSSQRANGNANLGLRLHLSIAIKSSVSTTTPSTYQLIRYYWLLLRLANFNSSTLKNNFGAKKRNSKIVRIWTQFREQIALFTYLCINNFNQFFFGTFLEQFISSVHWRCHLKLCFFQKLPIFNININRKTKD